MLPPGGGGGGIVSVSQTHLDFLTLWWTKNNLLSKWNHYWFFEALRWIVKRERLPHKKTFIKASVHYFKLQYTRNKYHRHFSFKWSFSLCTYYLGWMSCLISIEILSDHSSCQERVGSDKIENEKFLPTVGLEPATLRFVACCTTDWATQVSMKAIILKWPLYIHVLPISIYTLVYVWGWWSRAYFVLYMYCIVLPIEIYLYWTNSKMIHKSCLCFQQAKYDQTFYLIWVKNGGGTSS